MKKGGYRGSFTDDLRVPGYTMGRYRGFPESICPLSLYTVLCQAIRSKRFSSFARAELERK